MAAASRVIKACKFEDGSFTIHAAVIPAVPVEVPGDPMAAMAHREAEASLVSARLEADAIRQGAIMEAETITRQAREAMAQERLEALAQSREEGFAQGEPKGREAGYQAVVSQHASFLMQLAGAIEEDGRARESWFESQEQELIALALLISRKILHKEVSVTRESVVSLAKASLCHLHDKTHARVRVNPEDLALLTEALTSLKQGVEGLETLEVVSDPLVGPGGCVAESKTGRVDANLAALLEEVAVTLLDLPPGAGLEALPSVLTDVIAAPDRPQRPTQRASHLQAPVEQIIPEPTAAAPAPDESSPEAPEPSQATKIAEPAVEIAPPKLVSLPAWMLEPPAVDPQEEAAGPQEKAPQKEEPDDSPEAKEPPLPLNEPPSAPEPVLGFETTETALIKFREPPRDKEADPSRRAAEALALRLGKLKKGRGVSTLKEEVDMRHLEGEISDEALELIVRQVLNRSTPALDASTSLVYQPPRIDDAAEALADRLGKKKKGVRPWYDGIETLPDGPTDAQWAELNSALGDDVIDALIEKLTPSMAPLVSAPPAEKPRASMEKTVETLADRLGKKKKGVRPWYEGIEP